MREVVLLRLGEQQPANPGGVNAAVASALPQLVDMMTANLLSEAGSLCFSADDEDVLITNFGVTTVRLLC